MTNYEQGYYFEISLCIYVFFIIVLFATLVYHDCREVDLKIKINDLTRENEILLSKLKNKA